MNEFKPGLEGVVAFETEITEPDREGGALRYRGVDIEELVGRYPYEQVWGLLVDETSLGDAGPGAVRAGGPERRRAWPTSRRRPRGSRAIWGLGKLNDISDEQARDDLAACPRR